MLEEYDIDRLNPRSNPYAKELKKRLQSRYRRVSNKRELKMMWKCSLRSNLAEISGDII